MAQTANAGGTHSKPRALKVVEGNPGRRPLEPEVNFDRGVPIKPEDLSEDAAWLWDLVISQMSTVGLLKPLDAASLEAVCETFARWREAVRYRRERGFLGKNSQGVVAAPWVGVEERASREFRAWCAEYGLTPAAEKHLSGDDEGDQGDYNPFA
ncbi:P27 family phage terminase small subunit [Rothia koreensis]|uniref:P27 family phage terminase small subunit n=1 Tax=Rothia koreensis TaxID=592378 RepID=UPI003F2741E2